MAVTQTDLTDLHLIDAAAHVRLERIGARQGLDITADRLALVAILAIDA